MRLNPQLRLILETKRPTNNPQQNLAVITGLLKQQGASYVVDAFNNVTVDLGGVTCFTSHTDTVDNKLGTNTLNIDTKGIITVKGGGVLGADCGSGMYIMLRMIAAQVQGLYVFFATEEMGRIGSSAYTMPDHIKHCVSFDRKGTDNLITHQMGELGCSDAFADAFIAAFDLPYKKDPTGSFTDSYSFFGKVSECINLSVGYYDQHSKNERQDLPFLEKLVDACIAMDWSALPAERDPTILPTYDYDDVWGLKYYNKANWTSSPSARNDAFEIEDFVYENPWVVAELLQEYGITRADLDAYKAEYDSYVGDDYDDPANTK